jgi:hypothetical protein
MVEYIMKKEICGTFHAKCGTWRKFSGLSRERRDGWSPYSKLVLFNILTRQYRDGLPCEVGVWLSAMTSLPMILRKDLWRQTHDVRLYPITREWLNGFSLNSERASGLGGSQKQNF